MIPSFGTGWLYHFFFEIFDHFYSILEQTTSSPSVSAIPDQGNTLNGNDK